MGQITVEKNVGGIEGLCVITPAVHGDAADISWRHIGNCETRDARSQT